MTIFSFLCCSIAVVLTITAYGPDSVRASGHKCKKLASFKKRSFTVTETKTIPQALAGLDFLFNNNKIDQWPTLHPDVLLLVDGVETHGNASEHKRILKQFRTVLKDMKMRALEFYRISEHYAYLVCESQFTAILPNSSEDMKVNTKGIIIFKYVPDHRLWLPYRDATTIIEDVSSLMSGLDLTIRK